MNGNEERLLQALATLAAHETRGPSPNLQMKLLKRVRLQRSRWVLPIGAVAFAAAVLLAIFRRPALVYEPAIPPLMRIPYTEPVGDMDRAEVVRVSMPAAQLLYWGFPFPGSDPNSTVNADVLVGEDGLARAVRVVP